MPVTTTLRTGKRGAAELDIPPGETTMIAVIVRTHLRVEEVEGMVVGVVVATGMEEVEGMVVEEVKVMEQEEVGEAQGMEGQEALEGATIGYTVAVLGCELATV